MRVFDGWNMEEAVCGSTELELLHMQLLEFTQ